MRVYCNPKSILYAVNSDILRVNHAHNLHILKEQNVFIGNMFIK